MSDRRPVENLYVPQGYTFVYDDGEAATYFPTYSEASPADLVAAVRRGVESGTIKGAELRVNDANKRDDFTPVIYMPGSSYGERFLVIPVSDGGSET